MKRPPRSRAAGQPTALMIAALALLVGGCAPAAEEVFEPEIPALPSVPLGLDDTFLVVPADNPMTPEKVALGWQLFYDPRLSGDESISCATCHIAEFGFGDPDPISLGVNNARGRRNSNPVLNAAFSASQYWDGRAASLEEQALGPLRDPVEMAATLRTVELRLTRIPGYQAQFAAIFGTEEVTADQVGKAIAAFERVLLAGNSPWDRWVSKQDETAVSESARRGHELFMGRAGCSQCHVGSVFTDSPYGLYHNIGVGMDSDAPDYGRFEVTGEDVDRGAFKTPSLRNVAQTAPYMHDGSIATLDEVVAFYARGGVPNPWLDPKMAPVDLSEQEKADLIEFMRSLTGEVPEWTKRAPPLPPDAEES